MLKSFYGDFHKTVETTENTAERASVDAARELGKDPKTGRNIYAKLGKYGPYVQLGETEDEDRKFASLRKGQYLESITIEDALELFKLPRELGEFESKPIKANIGRFGPYVMHDGLFASLPKELDPFSVDLETGIQLIKEKREIEAKKLVKEFKEDEGLKILNGRWGPYISFKKKNYKIPKEKEPTELSYEEVVDIIENAPAKKPRAKKTTKAKK
jgi:DNA topoisomerase-1